MSYSQSYGSYGSYNHPSQAGGYGGRAPPPGGFGGSQGSYGRGPYGGHASGGGGGGFVAPSSHAMAAMPPGADPQLWSWFTSVDLDRSGDISHIELERALINGDWTPFDLDTVKLLMTIFDTDRSGTIGFPEFAGLWKYIKDWQNVFRHFDRDRSGSIDGGELRDALNQFGYSLSPPLLDLVHKKYARSTAPISQGAGISFDKFVRVCVVIKQLSEAFRRLDTDRDGWIHINYEQFMQTVLSLP